MRLGKLCEIVRGSSPRPKSDPRFYGGPIPRLTVGDVTRDGKLVRPQLDSLTAEGAKQSRPMKAGDLVIAVSGNPGLPSILQIDACIHDGFVGLRKLNNSIVLADYLYYFLFSIKEKNKRQAVGAIFKNLTTEQICNFEIPLPSLSDQRKIATILDMAGIIRKKRQEEVNLAEELFRPVFLDMFGDPITNSKGWPKTRLGDICQIQLGKMLSEKSKAGINSFPYLRNANVQWRTIHLHDLFEMDFSEAEREKFSLRNGDLLVCEGGEVGKCAIWHREMRNCYFQKALHRLRPDSTKLTPEYLQELFFEIAQRNGFLPHSSQVTIAHLTKEKLTEYLIPTPPIAVQKAFTKTYQKILVLRRKEKVALMESENLFNSLLQRAFQGEL